jgi:RimJ/RimL family protein N-acetyltransferase
MVAMMSRPSEHVRVTEDVATYTGIPERIDLPGGVYLRALTAADLDQLVDVVNAELEHLRPWMPWAAVPVSADTQAEFLQASIDKRVEGVEFNYGLFRDADLLGGCGLMSRRGPGVLEIGYWLRESEQGRGLMTAAAWALTMAAARTDGVRRIEICCDEGNKRSAAVPRRLGYRAAAVEEREAVAAAETGRFVVWSIDADVVRDRMS